MNKSSIENLFVELKTRLDSSLDNIGISDSHSSDSYNWENVIYHSPSIRYGHLEYFKGGNEKIEVAHCVLFPNYFKGIPIFGFDVIQLSGKITGIFCDFTPSPFDAYELRENLKSVYEETKEFQRLLPEWAGFFSKEFISLSPPDESVFSSYKLEEKCVKLLEHYLTFCSKKEFDGHYLDKENTMAHIKGQNQYSINQRLNTKTQKALAKYVGVEKAQNFIENTLFPTFKS
jgi:phycocyanobilin:ferredoxin oxidoreductase